MRNVYYVLYNHDVTIKIKWYVDLNWPQCYSSAILSATTIDRGVSNQPSWCSSYWYILVLSTMHTCNSRTYLLPLCPSKTTISTGVIHINIKYSQIVSISIPIFRTVFKFTRPNPSQILLPQSIYTYYPLC
jgi:hypothetical protein